MIWFFGTSHTDGFADGVKHSDKPSYPEIVSKLIGQPVINFGTSGAQNLQLLNFIKIVASDETIPRPDKIIIEPRMYYDHISFPRLTAEGKMNQKIITWRSESDAYYTGWWNNFLRMYLCWQKTTSTRKRAKRHHKHLHFWSTDEGTSIELPIRTDQDTIEWIDREPFNYIEWCGEWYDSKQELVARIEEQSHPYALLRLEQELTSMIFAAQRITKHVGIFFWGNDTDRENEVANKFKHLDHIKTYNILQDQTVHQLLEKNHPVEYATSKKTYVDAHLGPEAHVVLAPYISNWIKE